MSQDHQALSMYVSLWVINNLSLDLGITDIIKSGIWVFYMYFAVISLNAIQSLPFRLFLKEGIYIFYWNKYSYADKTLLSYKHHNEDKSWSLSKILLHKQEPYTFFFFSWRGYVVILSILSLVPCLVKSSFTFRWQWGNSFFLR